MTRTRRRGTGLLVAAILLTLAAAPALAQAQRTGPDPGMGGVIGDVRATTGRCLRTLRVRRVLEPGVEQGPGVRALPIRPGIGAVIVCVTAGTDVLVVGRFVLVHHTGFFRPTEPPLVTATRIYVGRRDESDAEPRGETSHP